MDVEFISTWLRAKYAISIRETRKGAEDRDFELLGEKFHTWVRMNARTQMRLTQPKQYKELVTVEMPLMTRLYLRIKAYSEKMTKGFEAVYYNAHRDISYQNYFVLSAVRVDDAQRSSIRRYGSSQPSSTFLPPRASSTTKRSTGIPTGRCCSA